MQITVQPIAGFAELAFKQRQAAVIEPATAHVHRQIGRIKPHFQRFLFDRGAQLRRHFAAAIDLGFVRRQLLCNKSAHRLNQHGLLFG